MKTYRYPPTTARQFFTEVVPVPRWLYWLLLTSAIMGALNMALGALIRIAA